MTFEEAFRQALLNSSPRLLDCMRQLLDRNDFVNLAVLDPSAQQVMGHFSRRIERFWCHDVTREHYLCVRMNGNRVVAYRLKSELGDIVREVLAQMERRG